MPSKWWIGILLSVSLIAAVDDDERTQDLFQRHQWFDLRGVHPKDPYADALVRGSVAAAFNQPAEAEPQLRRAIKLATTADQRMAARELLIRLLMRSGRSRDAVNELQVIEKREREQRPGVSETLRILGPAAAAGNQSVQLPKEGFRFDCQVKPVGVTASVAVNGKAGFQWGLDTGFNFTSVTESEARKAGIQFTGDSTPNDPRKPGVIARLVIGKAELRNVPVLVHPDGEWADSVPRGVIGLPVAAALGVIRWNRQGLCEAGSPSETANNTSSNANLAFDGLNPVVRTAIPGNARPLDLLVETGNRGGLQLGKRFADDFEQIRDSPTLSFEAGGLPLKVEPLKLYEFPTGAGWYHGALGMDVFRLAREVTLDFRSMRLSMR